MIRVFIAGIFLSCYTHPFVGTCNFGKYTHSRLTKLQDTYSFEITWNSKTAAFEWDLLAIYNSEITWFKMLNPCDVSEKLNKATFIVRGRYWMSEKNGSFILGLKWRGNATEMTIELCEAKYTLYLDIRENTMESLNEDFALSKCITEDDMRKEWWECSHLCRCQGIGNYVCGPDRCAAYNDMKALNTSAEWTSWCQVIKPTLRADNSDHYCIRQFCQDYGVV